MPNGGGAMPKGGGTMPKGGGAMPKGGGAMPKGGGAMPKGGGGMPKGGGGMPKGGGGMPKPSSKSSPKFAALCPGSRHIGQLLRIRKEAITQSAWKRCPQRPTDTEDPKVMSS
jgi:hypothetical protein